MNEIEVKIRKHGGQILMMQKMAMAMNAQGKTEAMLNLLEQIKDTSDLIFTLAAQGYKDGLVVYVNATSFITRTLSDAGLTAKAFVSGMEALLRSMELIEIHNQKNVFEPIPDEMECNFKTIQLLPLVIMFNELANVESNRQVFENDFEPFDDLHQIFIKAMRQLKMLAPTSPYVAQAAPIFNAISQMEDPDKFYDATVKDIKEIAQSILYAVERMPFYDSDVQAESQMSRFDGFYRDKWYDIIHDDDIKYNFQLP